MTLLMLMYNTMTLIYDINVKHWGGSRMSLMSM